jgi:hypothetical protein
MRTWAAAAALLAALALTTLSIFVALTLLDEPDMGAVPTPGPAQLAPQQQQQPLVVVRAVRSMPTISVAQIVARHPALATAHRRSAHRAPAPTGPARSADGQRVKPVEVEVWVRAAIGHYLWSHVLGGPAALAVDGTMVRSVGTVTVTVRGTAKDTVAHQFPELTADERQQQQSAVVVLTAIAVPAAQSRSSTVERIVLVLNGRTPEKVVDALRWIDYVLENCSQLRRLALVLHGSETCENEWLLDALRSRPRLAAVLSTIWMVYPDPAFVSALARGAAGSGATGVVVRDWPLGVAHYRGFISPVSLLAEHEQKAARAPGHRRHLCNFIGTLHGDDRGEMSAAVGSLCEVQLRANWTEEESAARATAYRAVLLASDATLCPSGRHPLSYRLIEAATLGSIPVVVPLPKTAEEQQTGSITCRSSDVVWSPYRQPGVPLVFAATWPEAVVELRKLAALSDAEMSARREDLRRWLQSFEGKLRNDLVDDICGS